MPIQLLHQVGHNANWNVSSFQDEHCGDGLILSPLHQNMQVVEQLPPTTRRSSIFDPQFYLPNSRKKKLLSYPFFPEQIEGGFQTGTFPKHAQQVAKECIDFQVRQEFSKIVIPTRFLDEMYPEYFQMQENFSVRAFISAAGKGPLCLSVAVKASMIRHASWRRMLLDWITSFHQVDELYLMYEHVRENKQIQDEEFLLEALRFFKEVMSTGLKLTIGYTNTEGLLYTAAGDPSITMGAFENTRIFSIDKFIESDGDRRGPKARIYLPGLLNWVQFQDAKLIRERAPRVWDRIYAPTKWGNDALAQDVEPTFNQPALYKHYFLNMQNQVETLNQLAISDRRDFLREKVENAMRNYQTLPSGLNLERHGTGSHLPAWHSALRNF